MIQTIGFRLVFNTFLIPSPKVQNKLVQIRPQNHTNTPNPCPVLMSRVISARRPSVSFSDSDSSGNKAPLRSDPRPSLHLHSDASSMESCCGRNCDIELRWIISRRVWCSWCSDWRVQPWIYKSGGFMARDSNNPVIFDPSLQQAGASCCWPCKRVTSLKMVIREFKKNKTRAGWQQQGPELPDTFHLSSSGF